MQNSYEYITYNKSFQARTALAKEKTRNYYKEIKEELLSYKGIRSRISWQYDSFSYKREKIAIMTIRGNTLSLYLKLDLNSLGKPKYKLIDESHKKSYEDTPIMLKIRGSRTLKYAKELINLICEDLEYKHHKLNNLKFNDYFKNRTLAEFVDLGLVKPIYHRKKIVDMTDIDNNDYIKAKIYAIVLPKIKGVNLYVVGNKNEVGNWDTSYVCKMNKVYDNFYKIELLLPKGYFEFKIVAAKNYKFVEKGIWHEEIVNHHYELNQDILIEDIIHHINYEGELV